MAASAVFPAMRPTITASAVTYSCCNQAAEHQRHHKGQQGRTDGAGNQAFVSFHAILPFLRKQMTGHAVFFGQPAHFRFFLGALFKALAATIPKWAARRNIQGAGWLRVNNRNRLPRVRIQVQDCINECTGIGVPGLSAQILPR